MNPFSLHGQGAAFLTAGLIAKSDKIESSRYTINLWNDMREKLSIKSRLDYLVALLSYGQVMDRRVGKGNHFQLINDSLLNIKRELVIELTYPILGEKNGSSILAEAYIVRINDAASALLAAAVTSISKKVESTKELINIWSQIRNMNMVNDNSEYLTALLASSRLNDLKQVIDDGDSIELILDNFKNLLNSVEPKLKVTKCDLAAAHLTIALISQTPEIESNAQVLDNWKKLKSEFEINDDDLSITAAILSGGLILNRTMKLELADIYEIFSGIKNRLEIYTGAN